MINTKATSRSTEIIVQNLENEILIYDLKTNKAFCLNETSALIFQLCDGNKTVAQIKDLLSVKLKTQISEDLVWLALDGLKKNNLMENQECVLLILYFSICSFRGNELLNLLGPLEKSRSVV